ncbi:alpha/beta fold hydrolase [Flavicella sp.]|uniref:YheT family hydrolase n=1 Tax=Flavicella sp. TaxID=2957742 RepID=UPI00301B01C6
MPIINSDFKATFPFSNKHFSTVYRTLFTNQKVNFNRERIETEDGDFLDLDFSTVKSDQLVVLIHGLEGSSNSKYILSSTYFLNQNKYDIVVINLRGCSGELNRLYKSYHTGETGDLAYVLQHLQKNKIYKNISLLGFSLGGNVVLKFAGEQKEKITPLINKIIAVSPPCDLKSASDVLSKKSNLIYMKRFLKTLIKKAIIKAELFPKENLKKEKLLKAKNFSDFDNLFTAPSFGFKDAEDYWKKASSMPFLKDIKVKTFLLAAKNDPFLSTSCFPLEIAKKNPYLNLELTDTGGHIGFIKSLRTRDKFWFEKKLLKYLNE